MFINSRAGRRDVRSRLDSKGGSAVEGCATNKSNLFASTLLAGVASLGVPFAIGGAALSIATDAMAQDYTQVVFDGRVFDSNGAPVSGATVTIQSNDLSFTRTTTSDGTGRFSVPNLPPGEYTVSIEGDGYQPYDDPAVPIRVGQSSYNFTLAAVGADEIVVTAARTVSLEFNRTATGIVVNTGELSNRIPLGRDISNVSLLAPGAAPGDGSFQGPAANYGNQTSVAGASIGENAFFINGLNVTNHRTLIGGSRVPFEFYDTVEVRTGGYQAEYGRATGGVINAITRAGTNEFHAGAVLFTSPGFMNENTQPNTYAFLNEFAEAENHSATLYASGPILRDRLFFYGLYEASYTYNAFTSNTSNSADLAPDFPNDSQRTRDEDDSPFWALKLDWNILDGHRLEYTTWSDETETERTNARVSALDNSFLEDQGGFTYGRGGTSQIVRYTGDFTDWFSLSAAWGNNQQSDFVRAAPNNELATINTVPGYLLILSNYNVITIQEADDERDMIRVDADFRFNLMGDHHVRLGYDREELSTLQDTRRNPTAGGCTTILDGPVSTLDLGQGAGCHDVFLQRYATTVAFPNGRWRYDLYHNVGGFTSEQTALYAQDSWDILPNLTLQLGVRTDSFENQNLDGETFITMEDQIAPRVGFSWDPMDDGRTKIYGSFGTYYLPVATNTNIRLGGSEYFYRIRYDATLANNPDGTPNTAGFVYRDTQTFSNGTVPTPAQASSSVLDPFQEDEWVIGAERYIGDWRLGVSYTHRDLIQVIEDIAIDQVVNQICLDETAGTSSCTATFTGFHQYVLANPGGEVSVQLKDPILGETTLRTITFDSADGSLFLGGVGYPEVDRTLDMLTLTFEREFDGTWGLQGSYTWMDSQGNYEGSVKSDVGQDDAGLTQDFDQPGLADDASNGPLPNHREHTFRLFGTWSPIENFQIGANLFIQSPRLFGCLGNHPTDPYAAAYGSASFYCDLNGDAVADNSPTPRGSQLESDWRQQLDLSFIWNQELGEGGPSAQFRFDVFNVTDEEAVTDLNEIGEVATGVPGTANPTYGMPLAYQPGRNFRAGVAIRF
jgi:hypothetical protein